MIDHKLEALEEEDVTFEDPDDGEPAPTTATEDSLESAERITVLLQQQLIQFRNAAAEAEAKLARQEEAMRVAASAAQPNPAGGDNDPDLDLWREFKADVNLLPTAPTALADTDKAQVTTLAAFFAAIPWGATLPAVTFHVLGAHPSVVHGLIGDSMWQECWGEKHGRITPAHIVPYSLLDVLKFSVERAKATPDSAELEDGKARWHEARKVATERRARGTPY